MTAATVQLDSKARTIFEELGYTIDEINTNFVAERKWRRVHVVSLESEDVTDLEADLTDESELRLRCFVTWREAADELQHTLLDRKPPYDWAVIGVDRDSGYEVMEGAPNSP